MMIKRLLRPPYRFLRTVLKLNIIATLRVNFSLLSLREAIKFPVYVYGKTFIHSLKGKIVFNSPIHSGMLRLGFKYVDLHPLSFTSNVLWIDGTVKCCGVVLFAGGVNLLVPREEAVIEMGENVQIGSGTRLCARKAIRIGAYTQITMNCTVMDTNLHYVKNIDTGVVHRSDGEIHIILLD